MTETENNYYSQDEVKKKIDQELRLHLPKILKHARRHCHKLSNLEPEELINEAATRFLDQREKSRRWRRDLGIVQAFNGAMRSIADEKYEQIKTYEKRSTYLDDNNEKVFFAEESEGQFFSNIITKPEDKLVIEEELKELKSLFPNDNKASLFFECRCLGLTKKEIMKELSITDREYEALRKKVSRRFQ